MGNEQQGGTSHHFLMTTSNAKSKEEEEDSPSQTKHERTSIPKQILPTMKNPSWQIARDISMDVLSRKSTRLSLKPGPLSNLTGSQSIPKKYGLHRTSVVPGTFRNYRTPRMPTEKEAAQAAISYEVLCSFCQGPLVGDYIRCRVCMKTCHSQCLFQRGHITDQSFSLPRLANQDWSCPECCDLTRLLNQDELHHLIYAFEQIDQDQDGYIVLEEFLSFKPNKTNSDGLELFIQYNHDIGKHLFSLMDLTQKGVVAWSDFALFYSCKLIAVKDKSELTTKLTEKELIMARKIFLKDRKRTFDNDCNIIITREYFDQISKDLIRVLKKKYGSEFFDAILGNDHHIEDRSEGKHSVMTWSEFLCELSLLILLNRSNDDVICSQSRRASIPPHLSKASVVSRSRFSSREIDSSSRLTFSRSNTPAIHISSDEPVRKRGKIFEKLYKKKPTDSLMNFTIVENLDEEENINLPKLKLNARDDRKAITDPWTSVKEIEQLRNQPILIKTTRIKILKI